MPQTLRYLLPALALALPLRAQDQPAEVIRALYHRGIASAERGDLATAAAQMDSIVRLDATVLDAWWNLGLWRAALDQPGEALAAWRAYRAQDSTDWRVEPELIQAFQALADLPRRDSAVAGLLQHRRVTRNRDLAKAIEFCREQATVAGHRVMVFQQFEPSGDRMVFYSFYLIGPEGRDTARYSLGSYETTTRVARETGSIGPGDRIYHLDYYAGRSHGTVAFLAALPGYDAVRRLVWAKLEEHPATPGAPPP